MYVAILLSIGSIIVGALGLVHLIYTFSTNKFEPRDQDLGSHLRRVSPVISKETTMWKAWIGFNASHSLGALLFAVVFGYLAIYELDFLLASRFLVATSLVVLVSYLVLARNYWFRIPLIGVAASTALFAAGYVLAFV